MFKKEEFIVYERTDCPLAGWRIPLAGPRLEYARSLLSPNDKDPLIIAVYHADTRIYAITIFKRIKHQPHSLHFIVQKMSSYGFYHALELIILDLETKKK